MIKDYAPLVLIGIAILLFAWRYSYPEPGDITFQAAYYLGASSLLWVIVYFVFFKGSSKKIILLSVLVVFGAQLV